MSIVTKEYLVNKYKEYKKEYSKIPSAKEFCQYAEIHRRKLESVYGDGAYSKLQIECGDIANKLDLIRMPLETIMRQYGDLSLELEKLPTQANWIQKGLHPTITGLDKSPHFIKWSEFPSKFEKWVSAEKIAGYSKVIEYINTLNNTTNTKKDKSDIEFEKLINDVRMWSPARGRNHEESYKVELRSHLKSIGYSVNEESGDSNIDLLINKKFAIETKKDPKLADYDRLFGQLARHLQHYLNVIALIMDVPKDDTFQNFTLIVDKYFNTDNKHIVKIIKK